MEVKKKKEKKVQHSQRLLSCALFIFSLNVALLAVDHSRVKLTFTTTKNDTDYINASFIEVNEQRPCTQVHVH